MNEYITISTDTGLYNAGIVGLLEMLKSAEVEYEIDGQYLKVSKEFFLQDNLAELYLDMIFEKFESTNRFGKLLNIDFATCDENILESYHQLFKNKTAATICDTYQDTTFISLTNDYTSISKKNIDEKRLAGEKVKEYLIENPTLHRYIVVGDSTRDELGLFFGSMAYLKISQGSWLIEKNKNFETALNEFIFDKLREFIASYDNFFNDDKNKCLQCRDVSFNTQKLLIDMKFLNSFVDDPTKKKSTFWDLTPDCHVCPLCAFIYMLMPFGFVEVKGRNFKRDKIFINENDSIEKLFRVNSTYKNKNQDEELDKFKIISAIVMEELETKQKYELNNIEIIMREVFDKKAFYSYSLIGGDILETIRNSQNYLKAIVGRKVKLSEKDYIYIFPEVLNNILNSSNQWNFLQRLFRVEVDNKKVDVKILDNIFQIQIRQNYVKEVNMQAIDKKVISAKMSGRDIKRYFGFEAENKLRSYVYKLINALSSGNRDMFLDAVTRMYSGINKEIPSIFLEVFYSDESFKEIGYAYVLGLKTAEYEKKDAATDNVES